MSNYTIQTVSELPDPLLENSIYFLSPQGEATVTMVVVGVTGEDIKSYPLDPATFTASSDFAKSLMEAETVEEVRQLLSAASTSESNIFTGMNSFTKAVSLTPVPVPGTVLDLSLGNIFTKSVSGSVALSLINVPPAGKVCSFSLVLSVTASTALQLWSGVKYPGGAAPVLPSSGTVILNFLSVDGGVEWLAFLRGTFE